MSHRRLQRAISLARAGEREQARELFLLIVAEDEQNELAWLWLSGLMERLDDQIIAVENALIINPDNERARRRLNELEAKRELSFPNQRATYSPPPPPPPDLIPETTRDDDQIFFEHALTQPDRNLTALAEMMAARSRLEMATLAYEMALAEADNAARRNSLQRRLVELRRHQALSSPIPRHTTMTLLRVSGGPICLYLFLSLLHSGFRLWPPDWAAVLLLPTAVLGSLLLSGAATTYRHPLWRSLLGPEGLEGDGSRLFAAGLGLALLVGSYFLLLWQAHGRLLSYWQTYSW
jgi:tetratricopeptide (TPR) repeat protein